jgi:hypothetical protein
MPNRTLDWFKSLFSPRVAERVERKGAEEFRKLSPTELEKIGKSRKSERYVERGARLTKKTPTISKRQFARKTTRTAEEPRGISLERRAKINRRLKLVREARAAFEADGADIAARVQAERDEMVAAATKRRSRTAIPWTGFKDQLDGAIGPDSGNAVASRELPSDGRITDGQWHGLIDALKGQVGESSPLVKLLRSSGRYVEGGVWVTE